MWQVASIIVLLASECMLKHNHAAPCGNFMHDVACITWADGPRLTAHGSVPVPVCRVAICNITKGIEHGNK